MSIETPSNHEHYRSFNYEKWLAKLALHQAFEHEMNEADERLITREEAIRRMQNLSEMEE